MENVKVCIRGWLSYFGIASMKTTMQDWDGWLRRRIRMYIWKQWKLPKTRVKNLIQLGIPDWAAYRYGNSRKGYWRLSGTTTLARAISNKRLVPVKDTTASLTGTSLCTYAIEPPCTERYARRCERSGLFSPSYSILLRFSARQSSFPPPISSSRAPSRSRVSYSSIFPPSQSSARLGSIGRRARTGSPCFSAIRSMLLFPKI